MKKEDEDEWALKMLKTMARDMGDFTSPMGGDMVTALINYLQGRPIGDIAASLQTPAADFVSDFGMAVYSLANDIDQATNSDPKDDRFVNFRRSGLQALAVLASGFGLPLGWLINQASRGNKSDVPYSQPGSRAMEYQLGTLRKAEKAKTATPAELKLLTSLEAFNSKMNRLEKVVRESNDPARVKAVKENIKALDKRIMDVITASTREKK